MLNHKDLEHLEHKITIKMNFELIGMFGHADMQSMLSEIDRMKDLSHPNVMSLLGVFFKADQGPAIVMPYMANGSLLHYLKKERKSLLLDMDQEIEEVD